jgi:hypothetical protein
MISAMLVGQPDVDSVEFEVKVIINPPETVEEEAKETEVAEEKTEEVFKPHVEELPEEEVLEEDDVECTFVSPDIVCMNSKK